MPIPVPSSITKLADGFRADMPGTTVTTENLSATRWRVTVTSDRVRMYLDAETKSRGRLLNKGSRLYIDGQQAPTADYYAQLIRLFADPDNGRPVPENATEPEPFVDVPLDTGPAPVRAAAAKLAGHTSKGFALVLRRSGRWWHLCLENDRAQLRMVFARQLMDLSHPLRERKVMLANDKWALRLVIDGVDRSDQVNGQVQKALAMMTAHAGAPARPPVAGSAPVAGTATSVQVRNTVVMRN